MLPCPAALPCRAGCRVQTIAALPAGSLPFEGIKVQIKGRMSGKGGMTSKRVWTWGRTSAANISDPVDYAHEAVVTRAGYIGIKVRRRWLLACWHQAAWVLENARLASQCGREWLGAYCS
jgi:hypothetical protein